LDKPHERRDLRTKFARPFLFSFLFVEHLKVPQAMFGFNSQKSAKPKMNEKSPIFVRQVSSIQKTYQEHL
jgi:hypothetical protein